MVGAIPCGRPRSGRRPRSRGRLRTLWLSSYLVVALGLVDVVSPGDRAPEAQLCCSDNIVSLLNGKEDRQHEEHREI